MTCVHDIVRHGFCSQCRSAVDTRPSVLIRFSYLGEGLQLRPEFVGTIKGNVWKKSLKVKKLTLVLGLRGTLYDARRVSQLSDGEKYLTGEVNSRSDLRRSNKVFPDYGEALFKLRPFVHEFLREANKLFQLYVYDLFCNPRHAQEVISLLDPHGTYFDKRIITNRDSEMKNLDLVLADERGIVILDDKHGWWWPDDLTNLLQIAPYHFFKRDKNNNWMMKLVDVFKKTILCNESDPKSYAEQRGDEDAKDGGLANALELLKEMHRKFFDEDEDSRDVRALLFP